LHDARHSKTKAVRVEQRTTGNLVYYILRSLLELVPFREWQPNPTLSNDRSDPKSTYPRLLVTPRSLTPSPKM
jgi:hypothetical protein